MVHSRIGTAVPRSIEEVVGLINLLSTHLGHNEGDNATRLESANTKKKKTALRVDECEFEFVSKQKSVRPFHSEHHNVDWTAMRLIFNKGPARMLCL